jgi:hypothetical protein
MHEVVLGSTAAIDFYVFINVGLAPKILEIRGQCYKTFYSCNVLFFVIS